jgi:hypothetical protein
MVQIFGNAKWLVLASLGVAVIVAYACGGETKQSCSGPCGAGYVFCPAANVWVAQGSACPEGTGGGAGSEGPVVVGRGGDALDVVVDAAAPEPGATDAAPPTIVDGALVYGPSPNEVRCGSTTCNVLHEFCCESPGNGAGGFGPFVSCGSACGPHRECDETADCVGDQICCMSVIASPPPVLGAYCTAPHNCAGEGSWIACNSQDDCTAAGVSAPCTAQLCGQTVVQSCGPISHSACR